MNENDLLKIDYNTGEIQPVDYLIAFTDYKRRYDWLERSTFSKMLQKPVKLIEDDYYYCINNFTQIDENVFRNNENIYIKNGKVLFPTVVEEISLGRYEGRPKNYCDMALWED